MALKINIQFKLIFVTIALVSAALAATYYQTTNIIKSNFLGFIEDKIKVSDGVNSNYIEKLLTFKLQTVQALGESADLQKALRENDNLRVPYFMTRDYHEYDLDSFQLYSMEGVLLGEAGVPAAKESPESVAKLFEQKKFTGIYAQEGKLFMMAARALSGERHIMIGKTAVDDRLADEIQRALGVDVLFIKEKVAIASSEYFRKADLAQLDASAIDKSLTGESVTSNRTDLGQMFLYRPLHDRNKQVIGTLVLVLSVEFLNRIEKESQDSIIQLIALAGLVTILIIFIFAQTLSNPIRKLTRWAGKIQQGDYQHREKIKTMDEINDLAKVFGTMTQTIYDYNTKLELLVEQRAQELNEANKYLSEANAKNHKDLMLASKIQTSLVPKIFPESEKIGFSGFYKPMEELGGDLYDVFKISDTLFGILVLDVCGHGVPAALITTMAKVSFKVNSERFKTPHEVVSQVNNEIASVLQGSGDYFTVFYGVINIATMKMSFVNGGHPKGYILRGKNELVALEQNGIFVGVMADIPFESTTIDLSKGDRILLYTDGLIEARNTADEVYHVLRFEEAIQKYRPAERTNFIERLIQEIETFATGRKFDDDLTVLFTEVL